MKRLAITLSVLAAVCAVSTPAIANEALAKTKGCLDCHGVDKDGIGPAYKRVAARYSAKDADRLASTVVNGTDPGKSFGNWRMAPLWKMPSQKDKVTPEQAKQLVNWILSLK